MLVQSARVLRVFLRAKKSEAVDVVNEPPYCHHTQMQPWGAGNSAVKRWGWLLLRLLGLRCRVWAVCWAVQMGLCVSPAHEPG